jgi:hypothetical protein
MRMARKKPIQKSVGRKAKPATPARTASRPKGAGTPHIYTLDVFLLSGPLTKRFVQKNPVVRRTLQIRGDQTLQHLHRAIFDAFGRDDEHAYEFQFGKRPMDPEGPRYVLPAEFEIERDEDNPPAGRVTETTLDSLGLKVGRRFGYWFDYGDDWWHQINVEAVEEKAPRGKYPRVTKRVGKSPPQYVDWDKEEE